MPREPKKLALAVAWACERGAVLGLRGADCIHGTGEGAASSESNTCCTSTSSWCWRGGCGPWGLPLLLRHLWFPIGEKAP